VLKIVVLKSEDSAITRENGDVGGTGDISDSNICIYVKEMLIYQLLFDIHRQRINFMAC
jgi:hypothetical protein